MLTATFLQTVLPMTSSRSSASSAGRGTGPHAQTDASPSRDATAAVSDVAARMRRVAEHITTHADESLPLAQLARLVGMSASHFQRTFAQVIGVSPKAYQSAQRLERFKRRLREGDAVLDATFDAGYGSTSRVYEQVDGGLGMTPSAYRSGGAGETITYAVRETGLGLLLMAATARGVCLVEFGDGEDALLARLRAEFPRATFEMAGERARAPLDAWMDALDSHLRSGAPRPDLPLDLRGTAFQVKVWRFLMHVKPGEVISYTELAAGIGHPRAVRAVGSACGANRIAVLIPCHRALRGDGSLGGYRWGLDRKRVLLDQERRAR